jgi:hypothetical protein
MPFHNQLRIFSKALISRSRTRGSLLIHAAKRRRWVRESCLNSCATSPSTAILIMRSNLSGFMRSAFRNWLATRANGSGVRLSDGFGVPRASPRRRGACSSEGSGWLAPP